MMTREKAIALFEKQLTAAQVVLDSGFGSNPGENNFLYRRRKEMAEIALTALRPVSREQVEKVWRGEWIAYLDGEYIMPERYYSCSKCGSRGHLSKRNFCDFCGAPMTDAAVDMMLKRMKELK